MEARKKSIPEVHASNFNRAIIQLALSARNLPSKDGHNLPDPMIVIYHQPFGSKNFTELQRTEVVRHSSCPDFTVKVEIPYFFEEKQLLMFECIDVQISKSDHHALFRTIGQCFCALAQTVSSDKVIIPFENLEVPHGSCGELIIISEKLSQCTDELRLQFVAHGLPRACFFKKLNPLLQFYEFNAKGDFSATHRTEYVKDTTSPEWKPFVVSLKALCNGDQDRKIRVECLDYHKSGTHKLLGTFHTTVNQLLKGPGDDNMYSLSEKRQSSARVALKSVQLQKNYSFIDYVEGGTDLSCAFAIDFTSSNGHPSLYESLHYHPPLPRKMNEYELAIRAVGDIIEDYNADRSFPVLGFGAKIPPEFQVSHCFAVNGNEADSTCEGIEGVLSAYEKCLPCIQFAGPTNFAPVINFVADRARKFLDGSKYFILVILTDGVVSDMMKTNEAIVKASALPMSIVIVGVGDRGNFDVFEQLDHDAGNIVTQDGERSKRDIVEFISFRSFIRGLQINPSLARIHLAREILNEIPDHLVSFMKLHGIVPGQHKT